MVIEVLSRMLKKVEEVIIRGFSVGKATAEGLHIFHLLLADDTILLCDVDPE